MTTDSRIHFHIRWSGTGKLDYERFASREEAEEFAKQLVRAGEKYLIEEFDGSCERCAGLVEDCKP